MANSESRPLDVESLRAGLYGQMFAEKTEKLGRNLTIVATITLVVQVFNVTAKSSALVPLDFSSEPNSLGVFLALTNAFLLTGYGILLTTDLFRVREEWGEVQRSIQLENVERARLAAEEEDSRIYAEDDAVPDFDPWWEQYRNEAAAAQAQIRKINEKITNRKIPNFLRYIRLWLLGGFPIFVSCLALHHSFKELKNFVSLVF